MKHHHNEDKLRKYEYAEDKTNLENNISKHVVDALLASVENNYSCIHSYFKAKKSILKLDNFHSCDVHAGNIFSKKYSFEQAQEIIVNTFSKFDDEFSFVAKRFFNEKWIHSEILPGKKGGAFSAATYPPKNNYSYILCNYGEQLEDIFTLTQKYNESKL